MVRWRFPLDLTTTPCRHYSTMRRKFNNNIPEVIVVKYIVTCCFICSSLTFCAPSFGLDALSDRYVAQAIQGRLGPVRALLSEAEFDGSPAEQDLARRFRARFVDRTESLPPVSGSELVDAIVSAYREYWIDALMIDAAERDGVAELWQKVAAALRADGWTPAAGNDSAALQRALVTAVRAQGFHALPAPALPLQDLLLWRGQSESRFRVELTDQWREVNVVFLSDFVSRGWKHYAALGLVATSGWIESGVLYCVDQAYDPGTEAFGVSYLKHESRHLADMERFPGLPAADLEYRAKLTELAFASVTLRDLLEDFTAKGALNYEAPHAEANYRVTQDVYRELYGRPFPGNSNAWMTLDTARVNGAARRLLQRDSSRRSVEYGHRENRQP